MKGILQEIKGDMFTVEYLLFGEIKSEQSSQMGYKKDLFKYKTPNSNC